MARVALPHEERRCRLEDLDGAFQLGVSPLQLPDLRRRLAGTPGASPESTAACRIQVRSVSAFIPNRPDTEVIAAHSLVVIDMITNQANRPGLGLRVVPAWHHAILPTRKVCIEPKT